MDSITEVAHDVLRYKRGSMKVPEMFCWFDVLVQFVCGRAVVYKQVVAVFRSRLYEYLINAQSLSLNVTSYARTEFCQAVATPLSETMLCSLCISTHCSKYKIVLLGCTATFAGSMCLRFTCSYSAVAPC